MQLVYGVCVYVRFFGLGINDSPLIHLFVSVSVYFDSITSF